MPANDGRRAHDDYGITPIEESGEQCKAYPSRVVRTSGFDATLDVTRELLAKNQVLGADRAGRAKERAGQPQDIRGYPDECSRQRQHMLIMPESAGVCSHRTPKCPQRELLRTTVWPIADANRALKAAIRGSVAKAASATLRYETFDARHCMRRLTPATLGVHLRDLFAMNRNKQRLEY